MSELPTGTVSLLFSDIEGSTALLKRLGPAYSDALDGQRRVLRKAWADHGGIELGTEGDSFYVVFPTAEGAAAAAAQGQRDLAGFEWPGGEQVRVRMGIHTGSPKVHDGAYVGMDVHRAARIAGAAHGGQVLLSSATAELVTGCLPEQVTVKDLGSHQLKDITNPEHLFQLAVEGLRRDFPPPKTLGTTSSLPRPATPLVGRDGELAELTAMLSSPEVRLVTLTGPGGSGKTRLAIGVAERLVDRFPDGIYFVPLAAVTTADVMWTSIAEVLDVPPEGRIPPGFFDHVEHRTALFVLDNLEQISGADRVVAELLTHAPQAVVIATSRRPLNVAGERQHAVPPLELPEIATLAEAAKSGAVQMFVQQAQAVKASFTLNASNAEDVAALCSRLDGLPLAIELAAARTKLLSPAALLARLDKALDLTATSSLVSARQKTLRDTIAWSYDLLNPQQQAFFRRLGVFAGGADLDAITAVTADVVQDADPLNAVADLVDASMVTITEDEQGEPRVGMLETIRAYAVGELGARGELDGARRAHIDQYIAVAKPFFELTFGSGGQVLAARRRFELENDNFREALTWAVAGSGQPEATEQVGLALQLCGNLSSQWFSGGYFTEARSWFEKVIGAADETATNELARCLRALGVVCDVQGDYQRARDLLARSVAMYRELGNDERLPPALANLAVAQLNLGDLSAARAGYNEAISMLRANGDRGDLAMAVGNFAQLELTEGNHQAALILFHESRAMFAECGEEVSALSATLGVGESLWKLGRPDEAHQVMSQNLPELVRLAEPELLMTAGDSFAQLLVEGEHFHLAVRIFAAVEAMRQRNGIPGPAHGEAELAECLTKVRAAITADEWDREYEAGRNMTLEDALTEAHAATS